jgi:hypothetical protein
MPDWDEPFGATPGCLHLAEEIGAASDDRDLAKLFSELR